MQIYLSESIKLVEIQQNKYSNRVAINPGLSGPSRLIFGNEGKLQHLAAVLQKAADSATNKFSTRKKKRSQE